MLALTYRVQVEGLTGAERAEFDETLHADFADVPRLRDVMAG